MVFLELCREDWGSSRVVTGTSGNLSFLPQGSQASFHVVMGHLGIPLELLQGTWASSSIEGVIACLFSSCRGEPRVPIELWWEPQGTSHVALGK